MAQFQRHFVQELTKPLIVRQCGDLGFSGDNLSDVISVDLYTDGEAYSGGGTCAGACICPDGSTVALTGSVSGKTASVTLKEDCFAIPGQIGIAIRVTTGTIKTTVLKAIYNVDLFATNNPVDPGSRISLDVGDLINRIDVAIESIPASADQLKAAMAPNFSATTAYPAGAYVYYNGTLYRFTTAHAAGSWTGTDATAVALGNDVADFKSVFNGALNVINWTNGIESIRIPYIINSSGKWEGATALHIAIPVKSGDAVEIKAGAATTYSLLKNDNAVNGATADFCTGETARHTLNANATVSINVPSDCGIIVIAAKPTSNDTNQIPTSIKINGVEQTYNIRKRIGEIEEGQATIESNLQTVEADLQDAEGSLDTVKENIADIQKTNLANAQKLGIWGLRSALDGAYTKLSVPTGFDYLSGIDFDVFSDGYKFVSMIDLAKYKNQSANTISVTPADALQTIITGATSGDTIILGDGVYSSVTIGKSINLIAENPGKVFFMPVACGEFTATATSGVYSCAVSRNASAVYDISNKDKGIYRKMAKVTSIGALSTPGTWYQGSSPKIYVHLFNGEMPNTDDVLADYNENAVIFINAAETGTVYMEGITVYGGNNNIVMRNSETYPVQKLYAKGCRFLLSNQSNAVTLLGTNGYFQECEASLALRDGFNYHHLTNVPSCGLEIDCIAHDNGVNAGSDQGSNNGSTMHDGGKIIRINGVYYNNYGGNVADITLNTVTYNYGVVAFDSKAINDAESGDFWCNTSAIMNLFGCRAIGDSKYNLYCVSGTINVAKTEYGTKSGHVVEA